MPENDAKAICEALGGRWYGSYGVTFCPAHDNRRTPAMTVSNATDGRLLASCHNGCDFVAEILPALRDRGLVSGGGAGKAWPRLHPETVERRRREEETAARKRAEAAQRIWYETLPAPGSPVDSYLRGRGITADLPDGLRYHPECWHGPSGRPMPAMAGAVRMEGGGVFGLPVAAIHRTFLEPDGYGGWRKARVEPAKMMLGDTRGGYVGLRAPDRASPLVVVEGIETGLSLLSGLLERPVNLWAALSTSGVAALRLPSAPGHLLVAPDGDEAGMKAARALGQEAQALGWKVGIIRPPEAGGDWNNVLRAKREGVPHD